MKIIKSKLKFKFQFDRLVPGLENVYTFNPENLTSNFDPLVIRQLKDLNGVIPSNALQAFEEYNTLVDKLHNPTPEDIKEVSKLPLDLSQEQIEGLHFLKYVGQHGIIADSMGLGKSRLVLAYADLAKARRVLIVTPSNVKLNWDGEQRKANVKGNMIICHETDKDTRIRKISKYLESKSRFLVINYEMLNFEQLKSITWDLIIYDESHYLKTRHTIDKTSKKEFGKRQKYAKQLKANKYLYLSGTPLTNDAGDLWSILNMIDSKRFSSYWTFVKYFANVIDTDFGTDVKGYRADRAEDYTWLLKRYCIRRLKETEFEQLYTYHHVKFTEKQKELYKEAENQWLYGDNVISTHAEKFLRMCQISVSPRILDLDCDSNVDAKVIELISNHLNKGIRKIIVGCSSKEHTHILEKMISDEFDNMNVYRIDGDVKSKIRKEMIDKFKTDVIDSIVVTTVTAIAEGISIDECDYMIIADYSFKQDKNKQFEFRIFRPQTVTRNKYYDVIIADKVGREKIDALRLKQEMVDCIFDGKTPSVNMPNDVKNYVQRQLKYKKVGF